MLLTWRCRLPTLMENCHSATHFAQTASLLGQEIWAMFFFFFLSLQQKGTAQIVSIGAQAKQGATERERGNRKDREPHGQNISFRKICSPGPAFYFSIRYHQISTKWTCLNGPDCLQKILSVHFPFQPVCVAVVATCPVTTKHYRQAE